MHVCLVIKSEMSIIPGTRFLISPNIFSTSSLEKPFELLQAVISVEKNNMKWHYEIIQVSHFHSFYIKNLTGIIGLER